MIRQTRNNQIIGADRQSNLRSRWLVESDCSDIWAEIGQFDEKPIMANHLAGECPGRGFDTYGDFARHVTLDQPSGRRF
jgi:hypothetical protein